MDDYRDGEMKGSLSLSLLFLSLSLPPSSLSLNSPPSYFFSVQTIIPVTTDKCVDFCTLNSAVDRENRRNRKN